jgi:hypothetical protein
VHAAAPLTATVVEAPSYRCRCAHRLEVRGRDRHRRYYELDDDAHLQPVMARVCPGCGRMLPGKNPA